MGGFFFVKGHKQLVGERDKCLTLEITEIPAGEPTHDLDGNLLLVIDRQRVKGIEELLHGICHSSPDLPQFVEAILALAGS
jgi:hypothetical protein